MSDQIAQLEEDIATSAKSTLGALSHQAPGVKELPKLAQPVCKRVITSHKKKVYCANWCEDSLHIVTAGQEGNVLITDASLNLIKCKPIVHKFVMQAACHLGHGIVALGGMNVRSEPRAGLRGASLSSSTATCPHAREAPPTATSASRTHARTSIRAPGPSWRRRRHVSAPRRPRSSLAEPRFPRPLFARVAARRRRPPTPPPVLALARPQNVIELWNVSDMAKPTKSKVLEAHEGYISALYFFDRGTKLLSGSGDGYAKTWDMEKKSVISEYHGHEQDVSGIGFEDANPNLFATSSTDKTVRVWDMRQKYATRKFKTKYGANCCALFPGGKGVIAGCDNASWEFFDVGANNQVARGKVKSGRCESVAVSASGRFTYLGWDNPQQEGLTIVDTYIPDNQKKIKGTDKGAHNHTICSLAVAPDGSALLSSSFDCQAKVWGCE